MSKQRFRSGEAVEFYSFAERGWKPAKYAGKHKIYNSRVRFKRKDVYGVERYSYAYCPAKHIRRSEVMDKCNPNRVFKEKRETIS